MDVLIIGASLGGLRSAESLRAAGFDDRIILVGDEAHSPYDRPPLSKDVLTGKLSVDDLPLRDDPTLGDLDVDLRLGRRAMALDVHQRSVLLDDGTTLTGDEIIIATGARARSLPGRSSLDGVHVVRTIEDAVAVRDAMERSPEVVVIGAGFIGSEVASAARDKGLSVTVLERMASPMCRVLSPVLGERLGRLHEEAGSRLRCSSSVAAVEGRICVESVRLEDGTTLAAGLVVVGVGTDPNTEWLESSGLDVSDGVLCDARGRASGNEHVHAVGDVARWVSPRFGDALRTEHWTTAGDQAQAVAADLLGTPAPPEAVPYVWSDQFGKRIQIAGRCGPNDQVHIVKDNDSLVAITGSAGRLRSVVAVDDSRGFGAFRRLIARDASWPQALDQAIAG